MNNVRYITATHIGTWAQDKISRFTLLPQNDEPILWDFGSAARHHQLNCPWLGERSRAGIPLMRGAMTPEMGRAEDVAQEDPRRAREARAPQGAARRRRGRAARAVRAAARRHHGRRRPAAHVRRARDQDAGRDLAAQHVGDDGRCGVLRAVQGDEAGHARERGRRRWSPRCSTISAPSTSRASTRFRASAAARTRTSSRIACCGPATRCTTTSCIRTWATAPATTGASRSVPRRARWLTRTSDAATIWMPPSSSIRPGRTTAEVAAVWPKAQEFGFPNEEAAFALQMGHGIGLAIWEKPMISRLVSLEHPHEIKPGMVFALETFWPSTDGWSAARIEEEIVVTPTGHEVITRFPAEELLVAGAPFVTVGGPLPTMRETEARAEPEVVEMIAAAARAEAEAREGGRRKLMATERGDACARDGAGNRQAGVLAEEGRRAGHKGEMLLRGRDRQGGGRDRSAGDGILAGVTAKAGDVIPVGQTIAWLVQPGETPPRRRRRSHADRTAHRRRGRCQPPPRRLSPERQRRRRRTDVSEGATARAGARRGHRPR